MRYSVFVIVALLAGWTYYNSAMSDNESAMQPSADLRPGAQRVVYSLKPDAAAHLQLKNNNGANVSNWQEAKKKLESYFRQSELNNSSRYAATGLQLFNQLPEPLQAHPQVALVHADLLQFVHDYDTALLTLGGIKAQIVNLPSYKKRWDIDPKTMAEQINRRLFNLYLVRGDLSNARAACLSLRAAKTPTVALICDTWIKGLNGSTERSISILERLIASLDESNELKSWCAQALIDLYLYAGDGVRATAAYNFLVESNSTDLSVASQIIDHLIFNNNSKLAMSVLNSQPSSDPIVIRRAIIEQRLGKHSGNELKAKALIEVYELTNDPNHYYDIALWYSAKMNQPETAQRYADLHWDRFKSFHDRALRNSIVDALNEDGDISKS